jgi:hypothetical protein
MLVQGNDQDDALQAWLAKEFSSRRDGRRSSHRQSRFPVLLAGGQHGDPLAPSETLDHYGRRFEGVGIGQYFG